MTRTAQTTTEPATVAATPPAAAAKQSATEAVPPLGELKSEVEELREEIEALSDSFAGLQIAVTNGYLVKLWPDAETGGWIADCPTVRCACQGATRDEARDNMAVSIDEMLAALSDLGEEPPPRDV